MKMFYDLEMIRREILFDFNFSKEKCYFSASYYKPPSW